MNPSKAPLEALEGLIDSARRIPAADEIWADVYDAPSGDPLEALLQRVRGISPPSRKPTTPPDSPTPQTPPPTPESLTALLGEEVLRAMETRPLPGPARADALRLLLPLLSGPEAQRVQPILRLLLFGSPDGDSTSRPS